MATLASSLAHELNQPLTAIASYCDGAAKLLSGPQNEEARQSSLEAVKSASFQAIRAGEIVRRLRDFMSRGDTDRRVEDLPRLVGEANALALVGTREHGIEVRVMLDPDADEVLVDRVPVQQVLFNLIRNAIEAMAGSKIKALTISTKAGPDGFATLTIQDTGPGIDPNIAPQLFQPFVTSKRGGMGVGLSICRTIIEAHGGQIWFEPGKERGTTFHFTLPTTGARS
jgi:two-component system sensor kinase FixL